MGDLIYLSKIFNFDIMINISKNMEREKKKKDIQAQWKISELTIDIWSSIEISKLSLDSDVCRLLFADQVFKNFWKCPLITQTLGQTFEALRKNQKLSQEFEKVDQVFEKLGRVFKRLGHVFVS